MELMEHMEFRLRPSAWMVLLVFGLGWPAVSQTRGRYPVAVLQAPDPDGAKVQSGLAAEQKVARRLRYLIRSGDRVLGAIRAGVELIPILPDASLVRFEALPGGKGLKVELVLPSGEARQKATLEALSARCNDAAFRASLTYPKSRGRIALDPEAGIPLVEGRGWPQGEAVLLPGQKVVLSWPSPFQKLVFYRREKQAWVPVGEPMTLGDASCLAVLAVDALPGLAEGPLAWLPEGAAPATPGQFRLRLASSQEQSQVKAFLSGQGLSLDHPGAATASALDFLTQAGMDLRWLALQHAVLAGPEALTDRVIAFCLEGAEPRP